MKTSQPVKDINGKLENFLTIFYLRKSNIKELEHTIIIGNV